MGIPFLLCALIYLQRYQHIMGHRNISRLLQSLPKLPACYYDELKVITGTETFPRFASSFEYSLITSTQPVPLTDVLVYQR